ncbi:multiple antibiotic resistance protein [Comamonas sp. BIGb0152]|uniref:MarC family protein n=1 Tax=Comamonas sp. BIGb0152 TaxID=2940601 RepID=UPI00216A50F4|nr:MarC family protein [Comamonas sp. BIGb0152]MCS4294291.1 multiple antibiotic resistance protein [Comamonas sp. BIGb0152]
MNDIYLNAFHQSFWLLIATVLPALSPVGISVFFLALTEGAPKDLRRSMATRIAIQVSLLMVFFMLFGSIILSLFSLSIDIVRLGGGLLLAVIGWNMINAKPNEDLTERPPPATLTPESARVITFYPLTFPLSFGPGTLAGTITVSVALLDSDSSAVVTANLLGAILGCLAAGATVLVCYRYADRLLKPLGKSGVMIFLNFSAFILLCVGIQIAWGGLRNLIDDVIQRSAG